MTYGRPDHSEASEEIGQRYLILRQLREEPWGVVWLAQDNLLGIEVGLKLLPRDDPDWAAAQKMYEHEAILALKLRHPQVLAVFHLERTENLLYLIEEPFEGESLMALLARQRRFTTSQALDLLEEIGEALEFVHQSGEVHQSLNPLTILLNDGEIRLTNFAFLPAFEDQPTNLELKAYTAPEVIHGDAPDAASNVFTLGVLGFRLLAGSLPYPLTFDEPFPYRLEFPPVDLEEIPVPLQNVLLQCLSEEPEERLPDAGAFVAQLRQARELSHLGSGEAPSFWRPQIPRIDWQPFIQAGPFLKKIWSQNQPRALKVKEAAQSHLSAIKEISRRLWWALGLVGLAVVLIVVGLKLGGGGVAPSPPAKVAQPAKIQQAGGGPPLVEPGESGTIREAPPALKGAISQAPAPVLAPVAQAAKPAREERYMLVVTSYANQKQAQFLQQRLRAQKMRAIIVTSKTGGKSLYQVQVGPINGTKAAEEAASRIKSQEKISPKMTKMGARSANVAHSKKPTG